MASTYYLGQTSSGTIVARTSRQDYGYTHGAISPSGRTSFGTSYEGCRSNAEGILGDTYEVAEVRVVDRKTFMAATKPQEALPEPDLSIVELQRAHAPFKTREEWLTTFVQAARPIFVAAGAELPAQVRVSVGFPSKGARSKVIGECWAAEAAEDGISEVFIVPGLQADPARIADVLTHELIHAALGHEEGHGAGFRRAMKKLGLEGKATATVAGDGWRAWALPIVEALGAFPGAQLNSMVLAGGKKTQTTRYLKVACTCCDWTARVTAKHLEGRTLHCPDRECEGELVQADALEEAA